MASFCRELCNGLIESCGNCFTTPITRKKIYWFGGISVIVILLIVIICVSIPNDSSNPSGSDALSNGVTHGAFFKPSNYTEGPLKALIDSKVMEEVTNNKIVKLQIFGTRPSCKSHYKDAVSVTMDQINFISRAISKDPKLTLVSSYAETKQAMDNGRIAAPISVYGGHGIDYRLAVLRNYAELGVKIMTLSADGCGPLWARSVNDPTPPSDNTTAAALSIFRKAVIQEMNRLGIIIDIAGVDDSILDEVLTTTVAPVIAMGVGLRTLVTNKMNLDLKFVDKFKSKNGLLMVTMDCNLFSVDPSKCKIDDFTNLLNETKNAGLKVAFGGMLHSNGKSLEELSPKNLSKYYDSLYEKGFSMDFLRGLATDNFLSLFKAVEDKSKELKENEAEETIFDFKNLLKDNLTCYTGYLEPLPSVPTPTEKPTDNLADKPTDPPLSPKTK